MKITHPDVIVGSLFTYLMYNEIKTVVNGNSDALDTIAQSVLNLQNSSVPDLGNYVPDYVPYINGDSLQDFANKTKTQVENKANLSGANFTGNISAPNFSGTNTGDETPASIAIKLGYVPENP